MRSLNLLLASPDETLRFGAALGRCISRSNPGALLLFGDLGAGKTTLTRALVAALPGGDLAEVASPSFTICNIYCTAPVIHHFDLYRLEAGRPDESLAESLDDPSVLTVIEWPERLGRAEYPDDGLACRLRHARDADARALALSPLGPMGAHCLHVFSSQYPLP